MHDLPRYAFGDFQLDTGRVQLLRAGGEPIPLEPKAFAVLRLLAERAPHVVDKAEIFAIVWKDTAVTDNALTRVIAQLRKALGDDAKDPRYIATVSARGYRLLPAIRPAPGLPAPAPAPMPLVVSAPTTPVSDAPDGRRWRAVAIGLGTLVLVLATIGAWLTLGARAAPERPRSMGDLDLAVAASLKPMQLTAATGYDGFVAFSPDGASMAYASDRSGALEIYVEGLADGSTPTSLTRGAGQSIQPAWSPDGRLIAYHDMSGDGIWVVPSRGGSARKIAETGAHPSWSPDGRHIVFQSRSPVDLNPGGSFGTESTIWVADVDGLSAPKPLTKPGVPIGSHGVPQWWPHAQAVVFAVSAPAGVFLGAGLWTVDANGGEPQLLSAHERLTSEFVVAPDGRGVLFAAKDTNALWWLPIDAHGKAGEPRPTALPVTGPVPASLAMSADGRRVAWTSTTWTSSIWSASVDAGGRATDAPIVLASEVGAKAGHPTVSSDGRIAFAGNRGNATNQIFVAEPGRPLRQLTTDPRNHFSPIWLTNQDAVAVLADHDDNLGWWLVDPRTGRERLAFNVRDIPRPAGLQAQVIGPSAGMSISRDFTRLAVAYVRDGVPNLWTAELGPRGLAGPLVQRTFETVSGAFAEWSPDGRRLAYQCARGRSTQLCLIDLAMPPPAPVRQLTHDPGTNFNGGWADDDTILFAGRRAAVWNVMRVSVASGAVRALTTFAEPRFYVRYTRWDRVNRRVVFQRVETTGKVWSVRLPAAVSAAGSPATAPGR
jgi:Tol biopolymer transport system component/DNA-binding winged helix-turn-helix (wHTH) protein